MTAGLSAFALGSEMLTYVSEDEAQRLYAAFREAGQFTFDTAHSYTWWDGRVGSAERRLGALVRRMEGEGTGRREHVVIITKGGHIPVPGQYDVPDRYLAPEVIRQQMAESLDRLNVGRVDWYLLHRDDPRVPVEELVHMLQEPLARGWVGRIGVSNWLPARIDAANAAADRSGWRGFGLCEAYHHLGQIRPERYDPLYPFVSAGDLAWYERRQFPMVAFTSTGRGFFAGHERRGLATPESVARRERARELARRHGATPTQIALAYLLSHPFPCTPLFATTSLDELRENVGAQRVRLSHEERVYLRDGIGASAVSCDP